MKPKDNREQSSAIWQQTRNSHRSVLKESASVAHEFETGNLFFTSPRGAVFGCVESSVAPSRMNIVAPFHLIGFDATHQQIRSGATVREVTSRTAAGDEQCGIPSRMNGVGCRKSVRFAIVKPRIDR